MLNFVKSRFNSARNGDILPGAAIKEEGACLALVRHNGKAHFQESTGVSGEVFGGFSKDRTTRPEVLPKVEVATVGTDGKVEIARPFLAGQIAVIYADGTVVTAINDTDTKPTDATTISHQGEVLTFADAKKNEEVTIQYLYEPTVAEARAVQGEGNGYTDLQPSAELSVIGRIVGGIVSTTKFDVAANWADDSVPHPSMGADGNMTLGGDGTVLKELQIMETPSSDSGFLTVEFIHG